MPGVLYKQASCFNLRPWHHTPVPAPLARPAQLTSKVFTVFTSQTVVAPAKLHFRQYQVMVALAADSVCEPSMKGQATNATQPLTKKLKMLELFSGLGGMHSSVARAVADDVILDVVAIDINTAANEIYALNFQNTAMPTDLEKITAAQLDAYAAELWTLSPPCQPYTSTTCSKQLDTQDPRAASFVNLMRQLPLMRHPPTYMMLENVAGFIGSEGHKLLLQTLTANGYNIQQFQLSAEQFGVPYLRPRYFALAKRSPLKFQHCSPPHTISNLPPLIPAHLAARCMPPRFVKHGLAPEQFLHLMNPDNITQYLLAANQGVCAVEQPEQDAAFRDQGQANEDQRFTSAVDRDHASNSQSNSDVSILSGRSVQQGDQWAVPLAAWQRCEQQLRQKHQESNQQSSHACLPGQTLSGDMTQHTNGGAISQQHNDSQEHCAALPTSSTTGLSDQQQQGTVQQPGNITGSQQTEVMKAQSPTASNQVDTTESRLRTPVGTEFCHHLGLFLDSSSPTEGDTSLWQQHALGDKTLARWWKVLDIVTAESRHCNCITKHYARNLVGAGSVLATREFANTFCRVDPRGRTHIPRDPYVVAEELGPEAQALLKEIRFLSPSEVCKLHGLDEGFGFNDNAPAQTAMSCLGNSLSVDVCAWLAVLLLT